jgi:hypothetical protein
MSLELPPLQCGGFYRNLDWRWVKAQYVLHGRHPQTDPFVDDGVRTLLDHLRAADGLGRKKACVAPVVDRDAIEAAVCLRDEGGLLKDEVEARILARQSDAEVADACGLDRATVTAYEMAFFCVRDRLAARDWITAQAIGLEFPPADVGRVWKYFAYYGGPLTLEVFIPVSLGKPLPPQVTATFREDPVYEEARLRLLARLTVSTIQPASWAQLVALADTYMAAQAVERSRAKITPVLKMEVKKHRELLSFVAQSESKPKPRRRRAAKAARPKSGARAGASVHQTNS